MTGRALATARNRVFFLKAVVRHVRNFKQGHNTMVILGCLEGYLGDVGSERRERCRERIRMCLNSPGEM